MSKGIQRAASALLIAVAFYSLLGFLILPGIGLRIANQQLAQYANAPASVQRLQFNPFSLELSLWGLHIGETKQAQIAFARLYANLQLDSLWRGALHLQAVELYGPHSDLHIAKDGTLNLTQLFKLPQSSEEPASEPGKTFALQIDRIALSGGNLHFQDLRPGEAIDLTYDDLNLELHNLSTLPDGNADLTLVARGPNGARIDWNGDLSLVPLGSSGNLKISDGQLKTFWPYVRDAVPLVLEDGVVNLATDYSFSMAEGLKLLLSNTQVRLAPLAIAGNDGRPLLKLAELDVSASSVDLAKQQVAIGQVRSRQLEIWAAREADGILDWQKLLGPPRAADAAPAKDAAAAPSKLWQVLLRDVQLRDYRAHLTDRVPEQPVEIDVGPLALDLTNFDSLGTSPFTLKLDTGVGKQGKLHAEGQVQLSPTSASLKVSSQGIDLRPAQAYLSPFVRLELRSGLLGSDLDVQLNSIEPLAFSVSGTAKVNQLHTLDTLKGRDFLRWQQLDLLGLNYRHGDSLNIDEVQLSQPYARFIINEDLSTNVSELLVAQPPRPAGDAPSATAAGASEPLAIRIGAVSLQDGSANFADFSLTPNFATAIQQLNGRIGTLDSRAQTPASVDIAGKVDRYAPVSIKGSLTPFDPLQRLDIRTQFKQLELTTLTPYSGKFAGYRIRKGRLSLDLHYRISKGQLNAENSVVVEQLQLGEKVDSPSAVDLPIRLAVALLKDTEGKIALSLPVSGDLNNPQFSVMPIVWKTLRNLVLRAAQAPFKFIGGLVGGTDLDLSTVHFSAGSSELDGDARNVLDTLANALKERPTLRLEVQGVSAQSSDGLPVAEQRLQREFQRTYYRVLQRRGDTVPASADQLQVPEEEKAPLLEGIYRTRLKRQPPAEWQDLDDQERADKLREGLLNFWAKSTALQRRLAQARAAEIKGYLVDRGGLPDARVYLVDASLGQAQSDGRVATQLQLDSE